MSYTYEITTAGKALVAKAQTGAVINFTKVEVGKGDLVGSPAEFTSLLDPVTTNAKIQQKEFVEGSDEAKITMTYTNDDIDEGFEVKEIGLFANDPDEGEILFLYCYSEEADYLPPFSYASVEQVVNLMISVDNASEVTAQILPETNVIRNNFYANSILKADQDSEPEALIIGEDELLGRLSGGNISALNSEEIIDMLLVPLKNRIIVGYPGDEINLPYVPTTQQMSERRILPRNGASLLKTDFPALFNAIGTIYGSVDDDHFNLPDDRGLFPRFMDDGAGGDPDSTTRTNRGDGITGDNVGTLQDDAMQRITGSLNNSYYSISWAGKLSGSGAITPGTLKIRSNADILVGNYSADGFDFDSAKSTSPNPAKTSDYQTNPKNIYKWGGIFY